MSSLAPPWLAASRDRALGKVPVRKIAVRNIAVRKLAVRKLAVRAVPVAAGAATPGAKYSNGYILQPLAVVAIDPTRRDPYNVAYATF